MKKLSLLIPLFFVFAVYVSAQNGADTTLVIKFDKTVHDYGTIVQGSDGSCEFKFTNTGKTPLILSNVQASCGCTVPSWTREPVQPGKEGTIKVSYNTNGIGAFNKSVTVVSNAKNNMVVLQIKGTVQVKQ